MDLSSFFARNRSTQKRKTIDPHGKQQKMPLSQNKRQPFTKGCLLNDLDLVTGVHQ